MCSPDAGSRQYFQEREEYETLTTTKLIVVDPGPRSVPLVISVESHKLCNVHGSPEEPSSIEYA